MKSGETLTRPTENKKREGEKKKRRGKDLSLEEEKKSISVEDGWGKLGMEHLLSLISKRLVCLFLGIDCS